MVCEEQTVKRQTFYNKIYEQQLCKLIILLTVSKFRIDRNKYSLTFHLSSSFMNVRHPYQRRYYYYYSHHCKFSANAQ